MIEIVMEGPGKNALGTAMMDHLLERLEQAGGHPVLLTGAGDAFSAGLNLKEVHALDVAGMEAFLRKLERLVSTLYTYPGPTVALVNGHAIAGGCVLALCCDHRVLKAEAGARVGLNEVALGLRFPPGVLRMVRERLSAAHQTEVLLGAALHGPEGALRLGLVDEVTTDADALARERLRALAAHPDHAYAALKRALRGRSLLDQPGYEETFRSLLPSWSSDELKQRIVAALKKR
ncbi:MAG: enoyl-CoA hydratase/isomerase family protein [Planctomycetes bacterium]|nr:enoyl-CoA hydratase/isomerase family protein [Planctomycetota bacterium]